MIGTLSRRLRVRDDGTGTGREVDGTFAEFETEDAIILLGDPGIGKTTFFKDAANEPELWTAWRTQLDHLYTRDAKAGGLGIYLVLWSGEAQGRRMPKLPDDLKRPASAAELRSALESLIPEGDRHRLRVVVVDISRP